MTWNKFLAERSGVYCRRSYYYVWTANAIAPSHAEERGGRRREVEMRATEHGRRAECGGARLPCEAPEGTGSDGRRLSWVTIRGLGAPQVLPAEVDCRDEGHSLWSGGGLGKSGSRSGGSCG